jgi:hypothetical protein
MDELLIKCPYCNLVGDRGAATFMSEHMENCISNPNKNKLFEPEPTVDEKLAEVVEETTGATIHFYYSKHKSKWVCWYSYQSFIINDSLAGLLEEARNYILDNREEVGRHYRMKEKK